GERSPRAQPLAANVDQVVVVAAVRDPEPNLRLLDRFLVIAEANRIPPVIVLNKIELERGAEHALRRRFAPAGYQVLPTSVRAAECLAALRDLLRGRASVLAGESGVGKSSLMNALHPGLNLRIGEVSAYWGKGKHTTRAALLVPLAEHGFVVDTPGLREVGTWGVDPDALGSCFPEFRRFLDGCRFDNCRHLTEPDCAVRREASFFILADPTVDRLLRVAQGQGRRRGVVSVDLPPLVIPFAGERYAAMDRLTALLAPPYDVISRAERVGYAARDPHNIVHLILPEAPSGADQYADAAARLTAWRREGVLRRDPGEAVYVVAQDYGLPSGERRTRLGMFAAVRAEPFTTRRVRPHEQTHSAPKADRLALLRATRTSLESIFLLAPDPNRALAQAIAQAARGLPAARAELDGVGIRMWSVTGARGAELAALAGRAPLYIADGHHRYETAVAFAAEDPRADRVLSFIVSSHDPGLTILPTHRIVFGTGRDPA